MCKIYALNWSRLAITIDEDYLKIGYNESQDVFNIDQGQFNSTLLSIVDSVKSWYFLDGRTLIGIIDNGKVVRVNAASVRLSKESLGTLDIPAEESGVSKCIGSLCKIFSDLRTARKFTIGRKVLCMAGNSYMELEPRGPRSYDFMSDDYFRDLVKTQVSVQSKFYVWLEYVYLVNPNFALFMSPYDFVKAPYLRIPPHYDLTGDASKFYETLDLLIENIYK